MNRTPMLHIFIGYDQVESVAYHTLCHSIMERSSVPIAIHPVKQSMFRDVYTRSRDSKQSNEFSFTRFLVPYLMSYSGWALFMDSDMLLRADINELFELKEYDKAVQVVQHDYTPSTATKFLGATQYRYPRKNWSSVMLFNCSNFHCRRLTPEYINTASALDLHRFQWTDDDHIGSLSPDWNWLVGEYSYNSFAKIAHYTIGGPWFDEYRLTDYADEWFDMRASMMHSMQRNIEQTG